jgi:hypothetical protein
MYDPLPRRMRFAGAILFVAGLLATIVLVATDTRCNAASNLTTMAGDTGSSGSCGGGHTFLTASYFVLVIGALLIAVGGLILPVIRDRNARRAAAAVPPTAAPPPPPTSPPPEA